MTSFQNGKNINEKVKKVLASVNLPIIYQDEHFFAINKPSGLLVHKTKLDAHAETNALTLLKEIFDSWIYPVHRLDKATSGVLLFSKDKNMAQSLSKAFELKAINKEYLSLVRGYIKTEGIINYPLKERKFFSDQEEKNKVQEAITSFSPIESFEINQKIGPYNTARYSLIKAFPKTGRTHQIRRHLKHIFHPIIGDTTYGDGKHNKFFKEFFPNSRLLLHCHCIELKHPISSKLISIKAPLPMDFSFILKVLRGK